MTTDSHTNDKQEPGRANGASKKRSFLWEYKITSEEFLQETSPEERETLRSLLNEALVSLLDQKRPVYLERFGIILPIVDEVMTSEIVSDRCIQKKESRMTVAFEKCSELVNFHRERHPEIAETADIAEFVYLRLPIALQAKWTEKGTRRLLRGLIGAISSEVVIDGFSAQIRQVGDLFALHNRQGETTTDWFAGANIILMPNYKVPLNCKIESAFRQPRLSNAWEIFEAAFGDARSSFSLVLADELESLGYDREGFVREIPDDQQEIAVSVFSLGEPGKKNSRLVFVTDGLRSLAGADAPGTELTAQVPFPDEESEESYALAKRLLTLGWVLLQSVASKSLVPERSFAGEGMPIVTTPFAQVCLPQRSREGLFRYVNVLGVTEDEFRFSELRSASHLVTLLKCKGADQLTVPDRRSIFGKHSIGNERAEEVATATRT